MIKAIKHPITTTFLTRPVANPITASVINRPGVFEKIILAKSGGDIVALYVRVKEIF
mgnify:CR=1 FL=1